MTFNNIEVPQHTVAPPTPNSYIFDGVTMAIFHDGLHRYLIIKDINTAVRLVEPNTSSSNYAYIIGDNVSSVFVVNPGLAQVRNLTISGNNILESAVNLNDFNSYRDISIVGSNTTQNLFVPQGGGVSGQNIVVGGYISNVAGGITAGPHAIPNNALCYMFSSDGGGIWSGPWFPFVKNDGGLTFLTGTIIATVFYQDNWYFHLSENVAGTQYTSKLYLVEGLGVDLIGDEVPSSIMENLSANEAAYQLPMLAANNGIYTTHTARTGYYFYNLTTETISPTVLPGINNFSRSGNDILVTAEIQCTPDTIPATVATGSNMITITDVMGQELALFVGAGKILIDDDQGDGTTFTMLGGQVQSDHYIQPSNLAQLQQGQG